MDPLARPVEEERPKFFQSANGELVEVTDALIEACYTVKCLVNGRGKMVFKNSLGGVFVYENGRVIHQKEQKIMASLLQNDAERLIVQIHDVRTPILKRLLDFISFHQQDSTEREKKAFNSDFTEQCSQILCELASAAYYLDHKPLVNLTSKAIASQISGKTTEELREVLGTQNEPPMPASMTSHLPARFRLQAKVDSKKQKQKLAAMAANANGSSGLIEAPPAAETTKPAIVKEDTRSVEDILAFLGEDVKPSKQAKKTGKGKKSNGKKSGKDTVNVNSKVEDSGKMEEGGKEVKSEKLKESSTMKETSTMQSPKILDAGSKLVAPEGSNQKEEEEEEVMAMVSRAGDESEEKMISNDGGNDKIDDESGDIDDIESLKILIGSSSVVGKPSSSSSSHHHHHQTTSLKVPSNHMKPNNNNIHHQNTSSSTSSYSYSVQSSSSSSKPSSLIDSGGSSATTSSSSSSKSSKSSSNFSVQSSTSSFKSGSSSVSSVSSVSSSSSSSSSYQWNHPSNPSNQSIQSSNPSSMHHLNSFHHLQSQPSQRPSNHHLAPAMCVECQNPVSSCSCPNDIIQSPSDHHHTSSVDLQSSNGMESSGGVGIGVVGDEKSSNASISSPSSSSHQLLLLSSSSSSSIGKNGIQSMVSGGVGGNQMSMMRSSSPSIVISSSDQHHQYQLSGNQVGGGVGGGGSNQNVISGSMVSQYLSFPSPFSSSSSSQQQQLQHSTTTTISLPPFPSSSIPSMTSPSQNSSFGHPHYVPIQNFFPSSGNEYQSHQSHQISPPHQSHQSHPPSYSSSSFDLPPGLDVPNPSSTTHPSFGSSNHQNQTSGLYGFPTSPSSPTPNPSSSSGNATPSHTTSKSLLSISDPESSFSIETSSFNFPILTSSSSSAQYYWGDDDEDNHDLYGTSSSSIERPKGTPNQNSSHFSDIYLRHHDSTTSPLYHDFESELEEFRQSIEMDLQLGRKNYQNNGEVEVLGEGRRSIIGVGSVGINGVNHGGVGSHYGHQSSLLQPSHLSFIVGSGTTSSS